MDSKEASIPKNKKHKQCNGEPKGDSNEVPISEGETSKKKRKADSTEGGKASFKRPKKSKGRLSETSTSAPSSRSGALVQADDASSCSPEPAPAVPDRALVAVPEPAEVANPSHMWREYDLEKIGIPAEARPTEAGRGKHSYTIRMGGATFDILMKKRGYYVKKPVGDGKKGTVSWGNSGGPVSAWEKVKKHAGLN